MNRRSPRIIATAVILVLATTACGDGPNQTSSAVEEPDGIEPTIAPSSTSSPSTSSLNAPEPSPILPVELVDSTGTTVVIESIDRIIPVDGDIAEIVFALGLGDHVVATDISATFPAQAEALPDIGYQRALNAEPIAAMEPTLVLATDLAQPAEALESLRSLNIAVVIIEPEISLSGPGKKIQIVANALGVPNRGRELVATLTAEIDAALAAAAETETAPRTALLYLRGERVQLMFGEGTGVSVLLSAVGATDVASEMGIVETRQITAESLLVAAPDVILVTTTGLESVGGVDGLLAIAGIGETPAGRSRRILAYEDQYLLGGGPRTGQLMAQLVADLHRSEKRTPQGD